MPLWGMNDGSDIGRTVTIADGATAVTFSGDPSANLAVNDTLVADSDGNGNGPEERRVIAVNGTAVTVAGDGFSAHAGGTDAYVRNPPKSISLATVAEGTVLGASNAEATSTAGVVHAGWVQKIDRGATKSPRYRYETLVAASSITGDAEATDF